MDLSLTSKDKKNFTQSVIIDREIVFSFKDATVAFKDTVALRAVNLSINAGEVIFITGASGAGKTTLLRLLSGELLPTSGFVSSRLKPGSFITSVFQDLRLNYSETIEESLMTSFDRAVYLSKAEFIQEMQELARLLGFQSRLDLKLIDANGGLKQKVAVARALLARPQVLLADEPTSSLDHESTLKIYEILNFYNSKRGITIIWASHNRELVKKFAGRIIHLDQGRLVYSGSACFI